MTASELRIGSLFSGIGGLELGLERAGVGRTVWQVERDEFCREVLARHWPDAERFDDVCTVGAATLTRVDVICGGFPCQDVSLAGKRQGLAGERSGLWREYARIIAEMLPAVVIIENVLGLLTSGMRSVLADLAALGFDAEWTVASASQFGAPHRRRRVYVVAAHLDRVRLRREPGWLGRSLESERAPFDRHAAAEIAAADPDGVRRLESAIRFAELRGWAGHCGWTLGPLARMDDGVSERVGKQRKALGNAVVVQAAEAVGRALMDALQSGEVGR